MKYPEPDTQGKLHEFVLKEMLGEMEKRELEIDDDEYSEVATVSVSVSSGDN